MADRIASLLDRARQPEYTGENRCTPCTILNLGLALLASLVVALASGSLAVVVLLGALLAIYLRGYLLPGTPRLTKRYLPDRVLNRFDTHPLVEGDEGDWETVDRPDDPRENAVDPEEFLLDAGAVGPCEHEDDLCLTDEFDALLEARIAAHDGHANREAMTSLFDTDASSVTVLDRPYPAVEIDRRVRKWPSEAALLADVATHEALSELTGRWTGVPTEQRLGILKSLRSFLATCPHCSGPIRLSEDTYESCCRTYDVVMLGCHECEQPLLEFNPDEL